MAIALRTGHSGHHGWSHHRFWQLRRFVPAVACCLVIFPVTLAVYDQIQPAIVKAGPINALSVEHPNWGRTGVLQDITVRIERSKGLPVKLYLDGDFGQRFALERTVPLPKTITSDADGRILLFDAPADKNLTVTLTLRPLTWGRSNVQLQSDVPGVMTASSPLRELILP